MNRRWQLDAVIIEERLIGRAIVTNGRVRFEQRVAALLPAVSAGIGSRLFAFLLRVAGSIRRF